jgi:hypothetical protein
VKAPSVFLLLASQIPGKFLAENLAGMTAAGFEKDHTANLANHPDLTGK